MSPPVATRIPQRRGAHGIIRRLSKTLRGEPFIKLSIFSLSDRTTRKPLRNCEHRIAHGRQRNGVQRDKALSQSSRLPEQGFRRAWGVDVPL
jgi:hypothetical protein